MNTKCSPLIAKWTDIQQIIFGIKKNDICNLANDLMRSFSTEMHYLISCVTENRFAYYNVFQLTQPGFK